MKKIDATLLGKILTAWFDGGRYITGEVDQYGDMRYAGFHKGHISEVVQNAETPEELTIYEMRRGESYLSAFLFEFKDGKGHGENLELIGMFGSGHDFEFKLVRNYCECHTTVRIKSED